MVMQNGRADTVGSPIRLGDFLPERRAVELNGQQYRAWVVTNRRFPRQVQAELDAARLRYLRVVGPLVDVAPQDEDEQDRADREAARRLATERADAAHARYLTESLVALVPGLSEDEADLIDTETVVGLLTELGYFGPVASTSTEADPDVRPLPPTGASSQPDSRGSTRRRDRQSS